MDRLQTIEVFVAVAEEGGFARAARRLSMSPPAVTRAVSQLEARLGCRLLHRTTRSLRLSEAGQRYLVDCRRILAEIEEAERHAAGIHAAPRGMVSVTASVMFGRIVLAPVLHDLLDRYPEISVSAVFVDRVAHLMDEGVDVAVRIAELPDSTLSASRIGSVRRVLCASPDYIAARGRPRAPADLAGHELINFSAMAPGGEWAFQKDSKALSIRPHSRLLLNTADVAIAAALAGRGITRVLSYMIAPQVKQGSLQILLEDYEPPAVPIHIVHKEPGRTSARVRAVVDHLVQRLRRDPALQAERLD
jgi:DNA-binding transcriptional LysR family regulator